MASDVKIMIVEDEAKIRDSFRTVLMHYPTMALVYETDSEQKALDYLEIHDVDAIILDIELNEGDGLSMLAEIEHRRLKKPFIIVVTNTGSRVTLRYLREHGADYIYQKTNLAYTPEKVVSLIEKIYPYQRAEEHEQGVHAVVMFNKTKGDEIARNFIDSELEKMGFKRKSVGFRYAVEAIMILNEDKEQKLHVSSELYPAIARKCHTTRDSVERGIRNAIEAVFLEANVEALQRHYPFDYDEEKGRPTNTEFLRNMASRLQL